MNTVFAGSGPLTTFVTETVSIDRGVLLAGAVTVSMLCEVWVGVSTPGTGALEGVEAEPPSTATTEYATRLRTAGCLGNAWGFIGRAWDIRFKEESADKNRRDVRYITAAIATRESRKMFKGA